jgi:uroporphyrinogen-III synthase
VGEGVSKPLDGRRVVITRAAEQSEELVAELKKAGAVAVVLPMVAFAPPADVAKLDKAIRELRSYDWVFLTSQNAVRAIRERCEVLGLNLREEFSGAKIAAVGPATALAAENAGLTVAHVASKHVGTALAEELAGEVRGKRVLLPRSDRANPELVKLLQGLGAHVMEVCAYKTVLAESGDVAAGLTEEGADAVLFFSPSAVHFLQETLGAERFLQLAGSSVFAAIGPVTEQALRNAGVQRVLVAEDASVSAVVVSLVDYFAQVGAVRNRSAQPHPKSGQAGMAVPQVKRG